MKFFIMSVLMSIFLYANSVIGHVEHFRGNVKVKHDGSIKKSKVSLNLEIQEGDLLVTSSKSALKLKLIDNSIIVLDEKSTIHFISTSKSEQTRGKIFYKITSRDSKNSLKIKTPFAIIGIKGTTFIVNATKNGSVSLKEGVIGVTSLTKEFELYREKVQDEFDNYISKQEAEFQKYKNSQNKYTIAEPTKTFDLKEKHRVSFLGNKVNEDAWTSEDDAEFEHFNHIIDNMK